MSVLLAGFAVSQMLYVAARLGIADRLATGPADLDRLAGECDAQPDALRRVIRALAAFDVFAITDEGLVANTPMSECLRAGAPDSLRDVALLYGEEHYHAMSELLQAVRRGGTAFEHAYRKPHFSYLAANPDAAHAYYGVRGAAAARSANAAVAVYEFPGGGVVVDVGGGHGTFIRAVLQANPTVAGVLVESAGFARKALGRLRADGLQERCEVQTGDIFDAVPRGGDVYVVAHVLGALDDEVASCLLRNCERAMGAGVLLVVDRVLPDQPEATLEVQDAFVRDAVALGIYGGRERTLEEHEDLLAGAGLRIRSNRGTAAGDRLLECVARP